MIKSDHVIVRTTIDGDEIEWMGVLSIVVKHREVRKVEHTNPDVKARIEEAVRNSVLRYMYEDMVPYVHEMGKMAMPYLPTHLQVKFDHSMNCLMDIFLGVEPGKKH